MYICQKYKNMKEVKNFNELTSIINDNKYVVVDCFAPWCGPCRTLGDMLSTLTDEELNGVLVVKVNVDEVEEICMEYAIRSIPTLLFFVNGENTTKCTGALNKSDFLSKVNEMVKK
jgi:thioredoxin